MSTPRKGGIRRREKSYRFRILIILLSLVFALMVPFAVILGNRVEQSMRENIRESNEMLLRQIRHDYDYFSSQLKSVCMTVLTREDVQLVMYGTTISHTDVYKMLRDVKASVVNAQPSILSVGIFNGKQKAWYSTESYGILENESKLPDMDQIRSYGRLQPLLRWVGSGEQAVPARYPVFSYYIYEYSDPARGCIEVNQSADWFINALTEVSRQNSGAVAVLAAADANVYAYGDSFLNDTQKDRISSLATSFLEKEDDGSGMFFDDAQNQLISYVRLNSRGDLLLLIQAFDSVFLRVRTLRRVYLLTVLIFAVLAVGIVLLITRHLYRPVNSLMDYVMDLNVDPAKGDEFVLVRDTLEQLGRRNKLLQERNVAREGAVRNMMLESLLDNSSEEVLDEYRRLLPGSLLGRTHDAVYTAAFVRLRPFQENTFFSSSDQELIFFSLKNVLEELMNHHAGLETVRRHDMEMVCLFVQTDRSFSVKECLPTFLAFVHEKLELDMVLSCSEGTVQPTEVTRIYEEARTYAAYWVNYGTGRLLDQGLCGGNEENAARGCSTGTKRALKDAVRSADHEGVTQALHMAREEIRLLRSDRVVAAVEDIVAVTKAVLPEDEQRDAEAFLQTVLEEETVDGMFLVLEDLLLKELSGIRQDRLSLLEDKDQMFLDSIYQYLCDEYTDGNLSMQSFADHVGLSTAYVSRKFKRCTGISLMDYLQGYRMKQAAVLLLNTQDSVAKIALRVGIYNESYFYHLFRKNFGVSPGEYRASMGNTGETG